VEHKARRDLDRLGATYRDRDDPCRRIDDDCPEHRTRFCPETRCHPPRHKDHLGEHVEADYHPEGDS
jgi:hypothetical protein